MKIKMARVLSAKGRKQINEENFALPGRRYPIHDRSHARNALARVAQHGTASEQARVRRAVSARYPGIGQEKNAMSKTNRVSNGVKSLEALYSRMRKIDHTQPWPAFRGPSVEKTAMPSLKQLGLAGLGVGGAGALGAAGGAALTAPIAGGAGYLAGHKSGMKRDAETPYAPQHMRYALTRGRQYGRAEVIHALRRRAMAAQQIRQGRSPGFSTKVKKAEAQPFKISEEALEAAAYVQGMRKSAHVNLQIPADVRGY